MPRRRYFLDRPAESLRAAARSHRAILADKPHPSETGEEDGAAVVNAQQSQRARAQRRNEEGKFV